MGALDALRSPWARGFAVYAVAPNFALFMLGRFFFLLRPVVNVDYLVLWALSGRVSRPVNAVLYLLVLLLDLVVSGESIYEFSTADMLLNVHYLPSLDAGHVWAAIGGLLLLIAGVARFARRSGSAEAQPNPARRADASVLIGFLVAGVAAAASSLDVWTHPFDQTKTVRLAGSRAVEILESGMALTFGSEWTQKLYSDADWRGRVVLHDLARMQGADPPYNLALIVVESEGLLKDGEDLARVFEPLVGEAIAQRYTVTRGALPFSGPTVSGELRALCGIRGSPVAVESAAALPDCLPLRLRRRGFETVAFHGNSETFFDRRRWYPKLGFDLGYFSEQLTAKAGGELPECGVLIRGVCDSDMARFVRNELTRPSPRPRFVYWLTLSSHLPVDTRLSSKGVLDCTGTRSLKDEDGPCGLERILHRLHQDIARVALDPALPPTRFVLVGDHAPVFTELRERQLYDPDHVPFLDLVPRTAAPAG